MPKQKLELTWIGKDNQPKLEPRILIEDTEKSYGAKHTENMLIYGDNLLALKALEQDFAGKIKCIYIDPPYNTGNAFEHYDDGIEHSLWLSLIKPRIEMLHKLLKDDGSLWITIDDTECHYLKVVLDELFGRKNFIANIVWQKRTSPDMRATIGAGHDHILVFAKNVDSFKQVIKPLPKTEGQKSLYKNPDNDPRGTWVSSDFTAQGYRPNQMYKIDTPGGKQYTPPDGRCWKNIEPVFLKLVEEGRIWFGVDGRGVPRRKTYLSESLGQTAWTWWTNSEVGHNQEAKKEIIALFGSGNIFDTPKPERLIQRILHLATNENDLILDSFLGSGTTSAVAHKMNRRWIGIELGEHCHTHCIPRLKAVIDGTDQGGISKAVNWQGGGGFKYYYLAPSLLKQDQYDNWVIDERYNADMLAAAMAKHEGFKYHPDPEIYWKHGRSTEKDYIFTTTQTLTAELLNRIHAGMKSDESLLICCKSFVKVCETLYPNITVKKIPNMLLGRCEFGREDYSFNIITMPVDENSEGSEPYISASSKKQKTKTKKETNQMSLFGNTGNKE
ncbi:MAG: site-specific DNA-methyltransferase [Desulfobacterales bacterium]|nr:site-specific DNA-methyltransferase [Desulfobacterales bacterium]